MPWANRLTRRTIYFLACAAGLGPFSLLVLGPPLAVVAGAMVVAALALGPLQPLRLTIQQERTPETLRSRVFGTAKALNFAAAQRGGVRLPIAAEAVWWLGIWIAVGLIPAFGQLDAPSLPPEQGGGSSFGPTEVPGMPTAAE